MRDNPLFKNPNNRALFIELLWRASFDGKKKPKVMFKGKIIELSPGQLTTGRKALALNTGINSSTVQKILKKFEENGLLEQQTSSKCRLITINNWDRFQEGEQQSNNRVTTKEQQSNTKEELKKERKGIKGGQSPSEKKYQKSINTEKIDGMLAYLGKQCKANLSINQVPRGMTTAGAVRARAWNFVVLAEKLGVEEFARKWSKFKGQQDITKFKYIDKLYKLFNTVQ